MHTDRLTLPSMIVSNGRIFFLFTRIKKNHAFYSLGIERLNTISTNERTEGSEPCWDGYQVKIIT